MSFFNQDHKQGNGASGPDFAALVERAKSQPGAMEPMNALWGAVYQLPYWRFVARGEFPGVYPSVCFIDGQHWVMAFTDESALRAFVATQSGQVESDASQMLLEIERVGGMLSWLQTKGVHHIMFNYGLHAFHAPLVNIPAMYEHFNGRKLPGAEGSDFIKRLDDVLAGAEREQTEAETVGQTNAPAATELSRMATEIPAASDDETAPARLSAEEANGRLCGLWVSSEKLSDYTAYHHLRLNENGSALFRFCGRGGVVSDKYEAEARSTWELTDDGQTVRVTVERPDRWNLYVYPPDFEDACTETKDFSLRQSSDGGLKMREETDGAPPQIYHRVGPPSSSPPGAA